MTREEYTAYLASPVWAARREAALTRAGYRCEDCAAEREWNEFIFVLRASEVHHVTYDRVGDEALSDLVALCQRHHRIRHKLDEQTNSRLAAALRESAKGFEMSPDPEFDADALAYWDDEYEERAAILEYDAGLDRMRAQFMARRMIHECQMAGQSRCP